jgi:hypothetical protein
MIRFMDIHEIARELVDGVGSTVVQSITGVKDRGAPAQWAKPAGPEPRPEAQQRLRLAHRVWRTLRATESPDVALAWMVGSNPRLGESTPVTFIRELRSDEVLGAAEAFVNIVPE